MSTLYVLEHEARVEIEHNSLLVTVDDVTTFRAPLRLVTQVVLMGKAGVTTHALHRLLEHHIPLILLDSRGTFLGRLSHPCERGILQRKQQYARDGDHDFILDLSRRIVEGKINNQWVQATRWARRNPSISADRLDDLQSHRQKAEQATELAELLGVEGSASRAYFSILSTAVDEPFHFETRNRRPPRDPVNALLSLGYTLLAWNLAAACEVARLDPFLGYYHSDERDRPALALDLMEEFRSPVVDSLVISVLNHHILTEDDFEVHPDGACWLKRDAKRAFARAYSKKLRSQVKVRGYDRPLSYQKWFEVQANKIARHIRGDDSPYKPFVLR